MCQLQKKMGKKKSKASKGEKVSSKDQTSSIETKSSICPLFVEDMRISTLRSFYSSNYWFIQDATLEVLASQLVSNRFVYLNNFLPIDHSRLLLNDIKNLENSGVFNSGYLAGNIYTLCDRRLFLF
jgi:hypothetical protein